MAIRDVTGASMMPALLQIAEMRRQERESDMKREEFLAQLRGKQSEAAETRKLQLLGLLPEEERAAAARKMLGLGSGQQTSQMTPEETEEQERTGGYGLLSGLIGLGRGVTRGLIGKRGTEALFGGGEEDVDAVSGAGSQASSPQQGGFTATGGVQQAAGAQQVPASVAAQAGAGGTVGAGQAQRFNAAMDTARQQMAQGGDPTQAALGFLKANPGLDPMEAVRSVSQAAREAGKTLSRQDKVNIVSTVRPGAFSDPFATGRNIEKKTMDAADHVRSRLQGGESPQRIMRDMMKKRDYTMNEAITGFNLGADEAGISVEQRRMGLSIAQPGGETGATGIGVPSKTESGKLVKTAYLGEGPKFKPKTYEGKPMSDAQFGQTVDRARQFIDESGDPKQVFAMMLIKGSDEKTAAMAVVQAMKELGKSPKEAAAALDNPFDITPVKTLEGRAQEAQDEAQAVLEDIQGLLASSPVQENPFTAGESEF